jgi:hypothetical protein
MVADAQLIIMKYDCGGEVEWWVCVWWSLRQAEVNYKNILKWGLLLNLVRYAMNWANLVTCEAVKQVITDKFSSATVKDSVSTSASWWTVMSILSPYFDF